jgi:diketogulonate reductase-like aldo/keto reductase
MHRRHFLASSLVPTLVSTLAASRASALAPALAASAPAAASSAGSADAAPADQRPLLTRRIPSSGETLPVIGMGTWLTFDVKAGDVARRNLLPVLRAFLDAGGTMIDSSPMYGDAEDVLGELLAQLRSVNAAPPPARLFSATKVWTLGEAAGVGQMEESRLYWRLPRFDLMQVHNLLDWQVHMRTLQRMKSAGKLRYIGVTTSHGRRHDELARIIRSEPIDFVQFTYNMVDRSAESRLLPLAREHGKAVIINRPFDGGAMFRQVAGKPLPSFAQEIECTSWSQLFLKWIVSHPAVTCAIPATANVDHMTSNMRALRGTLPDDAMRRRMLDAFIASAR